MAGKDLLLVKHLDRPTTIAQLASAVGRDPSRISRVVHDLEARRLVATHREGKEVLVARAGLASNALAQLLDAFPLLPWGDLLSDAHLELAAFLSSPADDLLTAQLPPEVVEYRPRPYTAKTAQDAVAWTGYSVPHVHRLIRELAEHAILRRSDEGYYLAPEHVLLREFTKLYHADWAWRESHRASLQASPFWQLGRVVLFHSREPLPNAGAAGLTLAAEFGVPVVAPQHSYLIGPWTPGPSDAILQTYLEAPTRTSNVVYACLLYAKNRPDDFSARARAYGLPIAAGLIRRYAEAPGSFRGGPFPPADEYRAIARQYEVE